MTVFKNYFKIVKQFLPVIMMYTVIFTFFAILATSNTQTNVFTLSKPKVVVINNDEKGELSSTFIKYVEQNSEIVEIGESEEEISDTLFYREVNYILIIPERVYRRIYEREQHTN